MGEREREEEKQKKQGNMYSTRFEERKILAGCVRRRIVLFFFLFSLD